MILLQRMAAIYSSWNIKISWDIKKRVASVRAARFLLFLILACPSVLTHAETTPAASSTRSKQVITKQLEKTTALQSTSTEETNPDNNTKIVQDKDLLNIQAVAQTGAIHLALRSLEKLQPSYQKDQARWLNWERERIMLLKLSGQNDVLVKRLDVLPEDSATSFIYWAKTQHASAFLNLQEYSKARHVLSQVIWKDNLKNVEFDTKWLPHWRRMIILSYLNQGLLKDAHVAITRFRQDYGHGDINDIILYARVLLMNNLADEALNSLSKITSNPEAGMLHLLAQLRKDIRSPRKILQASLRQMQGEWVQPELKIYLWSIVAEAAQRSDDKLSGIKAMEFILADDNKKNLPKGLFKLSVDDLWDAYIANAIKIGNKAQYLVGDDPVWLNAAQAEEATQPINARSLYAFLILRGQDNDVKDKAIKLFFKSLSTTDNGNELVDQLFLHSNKFKSKETIPVVARHFMVDDAISKANIRLASDLMASIKTSPQGADNFMWSLRRARVLVMGGNTSESAAALIQILTEHQEISIADIDKLIQVVFDLQTVKAHQQAYNVFEVVVHHIKDIQRQREIYYWMADSKKAQKQYAEAASLYLKSAMLNENNEMDSNLSSSVSTKIDASFDPGFDSSFDPWGQTARYQAAYNLAKAGLINDARALYTHLLKVTKDESRIKLLKHELQQLWLLENQRPENEAPVN